MEENHIAEEFQEGTHKEPGSMTLISALGITGLLSGLILVTTFIYTRPMIEANKEEAIRNAIFQVLPNCETYVTLQSNGNSLSEYIKDESKPKEAGAEEAVIYAGFNNEKQLVGFAIPASGPGFQDIISTIAGYDPNREMIIGFEVLESKETPGLGDKIFKDQAFKENFNALEVNPNIVFVKKGEKDQANEVQGITGATISSRAVVESLNSAIKMWQTPIENYMAEYRNENPSINE